MYLAAAASVVALGGVTLCEGRRAIQDMDAALRRRQEYAANPGYPGLTAAGSLRFCSLGMGREGVGSVRLSRTRTRRTHERTPANTAYRWTKDLLVFSSAHFIKFAGAIVRRALHGHNYRVRVSIEGALNQVAGSSSTSSS